MTGIGSSLVKGIPTQLVVCEDTGVDPVRCDAMARQVLMDLTTDLKEEKSLLNCGVLVFGLGYLGNFRFVSCDRPVSCT